MKKVNLWFPMIPDKWALKLNPKPQTPNLNATNPRPEALRYESPPSFQLPSKKLRGPVMLGPSLIYLGFRVKSLWLRVWSLGFRASSFLRVEGRRDLNLRS